jgi:phosphoglycolate phosphatase
MRNDYQLIVFDWDGTLSDSTGHIVDCMRKAIIQLELPLLSDKQISHIIGLGLFEAVTTLYPSLDETTRRHLGQTYKNIWLSSPHEPTMFDNALELVSTLNTRDMFLGVATGKSRKGLNKVLKATGLGEQFHATRCADECHSKPHPQMLEELMDYTGVLPHQTLMIGDTEFDMQMANNAGADCLAISHGAHDQETLLACKPQALVHNLFEVENWLLNPN